MIPPRPVLRAIWAVHRAMFRLSGGRIGTRRADGRLGTLFIETVSRRTDEPRRNALFYLDDGDRLVVVASNAGADRDPGWWLNLQAHPDASVEIGGERVAVRAREATPSESENLWPLLDGELPDYATYRARTARHVAVVILERR